MLTKNAVGNLINRYKAVLDNCRLLNAFGTLALAGTVVLGTGVDTRAALPSTNAYSVTADVAAGSADYYTTYTDADGMIYGVKLKNTLVGGANESASVNTLITSYLKEDYKITGATLADDGYTLTITKGNTNISNLAAVSGTKSGNSYSGNYIKQVPGELERDLIVVGFFNDDDTSDCTSITGDFIKNAPETNGSIISVSSANIGAIKGDFIGNNTNSSCISSSSSENTTTEITEITGDFVGNTVVIKNNGSIGSIEGDFIGSSNGSILNFRGSAIGSITGDFIGNRSYKVVAFSYDEGAAIYNAQGSITTITGNFIGNKAETAAGAVYNCSDAENPLYNSTIDTIIGDFIGNEAGTDGGAIYNVGENTSVHATITTLTGNFIKNKAGSDGGAIYNSVYASIEDINGNFIQNEAGGDGGAIYNYLSTIGTITGNFIGNKSTGPNASGGAIYNDSTITSINGNFIGNSSTLYGGAICNKSNIDTITGDFIGNSSTKHGGAIYNLDTIECISGDFIGNMVDTGYGGAIYTTSSLDFTTTSKNIKFSNNIAENRYNAIFTNTNAKLLTFTMTDSYDITMNDSIISDAWKGVVEINGQSADQNTFYLNDGIIAGDSSYLPSVRVEKATLELGTFEHADPNSKVDGDTTVGSIDGSLYIGVRVGNVAKLLVNLTDTTKKAIVNNLEISEASSLEVKKGTLKLTGDKTLTGYNVYGDKKPIGAITISGGTLETATRATIANLTMTSGSLNVTSGTLTLTGDAKSLAGTAISTGGTLQTSTGITATSLTMSGGTLVIGADQSFNVSDVRGDDGAVTTERTVTFTGTNSTITISNGATFRADLADFGTFSAESGDNGYFTNTYANAYSFCGEGKFILDLGGIAFKEEYETAIKNELHSEIAGSGFTFEAINYKIISFSSLNTFDGNTNAAGGETAILSESVLAGTLATKNELTAYSLVANTEADEGYSEQNPLTASTIQSGATLTLTGFDASTATDDVTSLVGTGLSLENNGTLNLGKSESSLALTYDGTLTGTGTTNVNSAVEFKGTTTIGLGGELVIYADTTMADLSTGKENNTFGTVRVEAGTLTVNASATGLDGTTTVNGGGLTIDAGANIVAAADLNTAANTTLTVTSGTLDMANGSLSGATNVTGGELKISAGENSITAADLSTSSGTLTVASGTLSLTGANKAFAGTTNISGGTLSVATTATDTSFSTTNITSGELVINANTTIADLSTGKENNTFGKVRVEAGTLTVNASATGLDGTTTVNGGGLTINAGTKTVAAADLTTAANTTLTVASGTLDMARGSLAGATNVTGGELKISAGENTVAAADLSTSGGTLTVASGTLSLTGANKTFAGATNISGGTLSVATTATSTSFGATNITSGELVINANTTATNLSLAGGQLTISAGALDVSGTDYALNLTDDKASKIIIANNAMLKADLTDFGAVTNAAFALKDGYTIGAGDTDTFALTNNGTLSLNASGTTIQRVHESAIRGSITDILGDNVTVADWTLDGLYSLNVFSADPTIKTATLNEQVMAGFLEDGETLTAHGIVANTVELEGNANDVTATLESGAELTLTGFDATTTEDTTDNNILSLVGTGLSIENNGTLNLGTSGSSLALTYDGTLTGTGTTNINSAVTFGGEVTVSGDGSLNIAATANGTTFNGATKLYDAELNVHGDNTTFTTTTFNSSDGSLNIATTADGTKFTGATNVNYGTLNVAGSNTQFTGATTVTAGTLNVNTGSTGTTFGTLTVSDDGEGSTGTLNIYANTAATALNVTTGTANVHAGTLDVSGGTLTVNQNATMTIAQSAYLKASCANFGDFTRDGSFTTNDNPTIVGDISNSGTLTLTGLDSVFTNNLMSEAAEYNLLHDADWVALFESGKMGTIVLDGITTSGTYSLTYFNPEDTTLIGGNNTVMAGDLSGNKTVTFAGITENTDFTSSDTTSTIAAGSTLTLTGGDNNTDMLVSGSSLTNNGTLNLQGTTFSGALTNAAGTTNITSAVAFSSTVEISGGTLSVASGATGTTFGTTTISNGELQINANTTIANLSTTASTGILTVAVGELTVNAGSLAGTTNVNAGTLKIDTTGIITAADLNTTASTGTLTVASGTLSLTGEKTLAGTTNVSGGALSLAAKTTLSGETTVNSGTLSVTSGAAGTTLGTTTVGVDGELEINANTTISNLSTTASTGKLTVAAGELTVNAGSLAGTTNVTAGTLKIDTTGTITAADLNTTASTGTLTVAGGTLDMTGGTLAGTTNVNAGTMNVQGANTTLSGATNVNGGKLSVASGATGTTFGTTTISNGELEINANTTIAGLTTAVDSTAQTNGKLSVAAGILDITGASTLDGTTNVTAGELKISAVANSVTASDLTTAEGGKLTVASGTLSLTGEKTLAGTTNVSGGALSISADTTLSGETTVNSGTLTTSADVTAADLSTVAGGTLHVAGGKLSLTGAKTLAGTTNIDAELSLQNTTTLSGTTKVSGTDGKLTIAAGTIAGDDNVVTNKIVTASDLQFNGGTLTVTSGTLDVDNAGAMSFDASGATTIINIAADGTLSAELTDFTVIKQSSLTIGTNTYTDALASIDTKVAGYDFGITDGKLTLDVGGLHIDKAEYRTILADIKDIIVGVDTDGSKVYNGSLVLTNCTLVGAYELVDIINGENIDELVTHGNIANGTSITISGLKLNDAQNPNNTSIASGASLTITGTMTGEDNTVIDVTVLDGGSITNNGTLILGDDDGATDTDSLTSIGNIITNASATTTVYDNITHTGNITTNATGSTIFEGTATITGNVTSSGTTTFKDAASISKNLLVEDGTTSFDSTANITGTAEITGGELNFKKNATLTGGLVASGGATNFGTGPDSTGALGSITVTGNLTNKNTSTMTFKDNTTLTGNLLVEDGETTFNGTANITGTAEITGGELNFKNDATLDQTLTISGGTTTFEDDATVASTTTMNGGELNFKKNATLTGGLVASGGATNFGTGPDSTGALGNITVTGNVTNTGTGTGATAVSSTMTFKDNTTLTGNLLVEKGETTFDGTAKITGTATVTGGELNFKNDATLDQTLTVSGGTTTFEGTTTVTGATTMDGGQIVVEGDATPISATFASMNKAAGKTEADGSIFVKNAYTQVTAGLASGVDYYVSANGTLNAGAALDGDDLAKIIAATAMNITTAPVGTAGGFVNTGNAVFVHNTGATMEIGGGKLIVDSNVDKSGKISGTAPIQNVYFGANSSFIVNVKDFNPITKDNATTTAVLDGGDKATVCVNATAKLGLSNAKDGTYTILDNFDGSSNSGWLKNNVFVLNPIFGVTNTLNEDGTYSVVIGVDKYNDVFTSTDPDTQSFITEAVLNGSTTVTAIMESATIPNKKKAQAVQQISAGTASQVTTTAYTTTVGAQDVITAQLGSAISQINSAPAPVVVGDTTDTSTMLASADIVSDVPSASYLKENNLLGIHIWTMPFYQNMKTTGLKSTSATTDSNNSFTGIVLGADKVFGDWRIGLAINAGEGGISSESEFMESTTDYNFFGANFYAGRSFGDFGFTTQLGYSHGNYDSATSGLAQQTVDMTSHTYAASVRGTYDVATSFADFTPYLGLGFMHFVLDDCELSSKNGDPSIKVESEAQNIWTIPFGLSIAKDFEHNGWTLTPALNLGGVFTMGDLESHSVSYAYNSSMANVSDTVDEWTFTTGVSLGASKDAVNINLGYDIQMSEHMTNHGIHARIGYSF